MKFAALVLLLLGGLPAFAEVGEKYADIEKRLGKALMSWDEGPGVVVYFHGPHASRERMPLTLQERIRESEQEPVPLPWVDAPADRAADEASPRKAPADQVWRLVFVVLGVSLAEEYHVAGWERAVEVIKQQRSGKGMGEPIPHKDDGTTLDWIAEDKISARYSGGVLIVVHPKWQGEPLKARLGLSREPWKCGNDLEWMLKLQRKHPQETK